MVEYLTRYEGNVSLVTLERGIKTSQYILTSDLEDGSTIRYDLDTKRVTRHGSFEEALEAARQAIER